MVNSLETIQQNIKKFEEIHNQELRQFCPKNSLPEEYFYQPSNFSFGKKTLVISGPSRNGNHLVHSLLDNHPRLPRIPGEDSTIPVLIPKVNEQPYETKKELTSEGCAEYLITLAGKTRGWEFESKWRTLYEHMQKSKQTGTWAGVQYREGKSGFISDYQDTIINIDYPAYEQYLINSEADMIDASHLYDILEKYIEATSQLDPKYHERRENLEYPLVMFGSGMRQEMFYMMACNNQIYLVTPVRPFKTYIHSFARSFYGTNKLNDEILKEGWEHWYHKISDYLILKNEYPDRVCLVRFDNLIQSTENTMEELLKFLDVNFHKNCTEASVLGHPAKGNSHEKKDEESRGDVYKSGVQTKLEQERIPELYDELWDVVKKVSI